ncbi:MAG: hypothetical protein LUG23_07020 [Oscillospiraceae bacterium]|nr:hypothetical protein [Oscillospiraceae bacterium]
MDNSFLLKEIEKRAIEIASPPLGMFTEERFIVALIDKIRDTPDSDKSAELSHLEWLLGTYIDDFEAARKTLMAYIRTSKNSFDDSLYMQDMIGQAERRAEEKGLKAITTEDVLICVMRNPSDVVKRIRLNFRVDANDTDSIR